MPPRFARLLVATSGPNCRPCLRGGGVELIEHHARLHAGRAGLRVQLDDLVHVLAEVQHDARADRLPGEARAAAARDERDAGLGGQAAW